MKINPYLAVIIAATLGGFSGVFFKWIELPATTLTFFRVAVPTIILFFYLRWEKVQFFRGNYKIMLVGSVLNAVRLFLYIFAYLSTSIANAVIILFTWPVFASILGMFVLKEKTTKKTAFLILIAFMGIVIMYLDKEFSLGNKDFVGMGAMLGSALLFSVMMVIFKKELSNYSKTETIFYQNLVGTFIFLPFIFINVPFPSIVQFSASTIYGAIIGVVMFFLFFSGLKQLKISHYSILSCWEVPAAVFFGIVFFNEVITWNILLGGICIIIASLLLRKG